MNIIDLRYEINTPPTPCSVCDKTFQPTDALDFICKNCQSALVGHCGCGSDDISMDWGIDLDAEFVYFWLIDCLCGNQLKSKCHSVNEQSKYAKQLHAEWVTK